MRHIITFMVMLPVLADAQIYIDSYRFGVPVQAGLLLDSFPGAAAAYSLRLLDNDYTGDCITVRRSSDNALDTFGFVDNYLDTAGLKTFCGTGATDNCFIRIWFDQSGNGRNVSQATNANQPRIMENGVILREGGLPTIFHTSGSTTLNLADTFNIGRTYSMYGVVKFDQNGRELIGSSSVSFSYAIAIEPANNYHSASGAFGGSNGAFGLNFALVSIYRNNSASVSQFKNTSLLGSAFNISSNADFYFRSLSGEQNTSFNLIGKLSEVIIYQTHQISNQNQIEGNIKLFYGL